MISPDLESIAISNLLDRYVPRINKYADMDFSIEGIKNTVIEYGKKAISGIGDAVMDYIHNAWDPNHPVASFAGIGLDIAVMTALGPFASILVDAAMDIFGVSFKDLIIKVQNLLASDMKANGGAAPSESKIDQAVNSQAVGASNASDHLSVASYLEIEKALKIIAIESRKIAIKNAVSGQKISTAGWLPGWAALKGFFGKEVGKGVAKGVAEKGFLSSFGGFIKMILKTIFKLFFVKTAAHFVATVAQKAVGLVPSGKPDNQSVNLPPPGVAQTLKAINWGKEIQITSKTGWALPVSETRIEPLIIGWATTIYPELKGHEDLITSAQTFHQVIQAIQDSNDTGSYSATYMPDELTSKYDVVSRFIAEVDAAYAKTIKDSPKN